MTFQSKAQKAKMQLLVQMGKIKKSTYDKWEQATPEGKFIPERVKPTQIKKVRQPRKIGPTRKIR